MRKMMEHEDLPPVVMPSCEVRKILAGQKSLGIPVPATVLKVTSPAVPFQTT